MYGKRNKAITRMIDGAHSHLEGMELKLPFKGEDIYKYGVFLTKVFFQDTNRHTEVIPVMI